MRICSFLLPGTFSDGSTGALNGVAWTSSTLVDFSGLATAVSAGTNSIGAAVGSVSDSTVLTVNPAALASIAISPSSASIVKKGTQQQYTVTGTFTDGSTQVLAPAWASDAPAVLTIDAATGLATAIAPGTAHITAAASGQILMTDVTVTSAMLQSLAVTPANPTLGINGTLHLTATGAFSDNTTQDLTSAVSWVSSDGRVAVITAGGLATGLAQLQRSVGNSDPER